MSDQDLLTREQEALYTYRCLEKLGTTLFLGHVGGDGATGEALRRLPFTAGKLRKMRRSALYVIAALRPRLPKSEREFLKRKHKVKGDCPRPDCNGRLIEAPHQGYRDVEKLDNPGAPRILRTTVPLATGQVCWGCGHVP